MSTLLNVQYTFTNNDTGQSITFSDGTDTTEIVVIHTIPTGLHSAIIRQAQENLSFRDGIQSGDAYLGAKVITWEIIMVADSEAKMISLINKIRKIFMPPVERGLNKTLHRLTFTDVDGYAKYLDYEIETFPQFSKTVNNHVRMDCVFTIRANDPRYYAQTVSQSVLSSLYVSGGLQVEAQVPAQLAIAFVGGVVIVNNGSYKSSPKITIRGPVTNPILYNLTTGQALKYNVTLLAGENIYCDCVTGQTTKNGSDNSSELADDSTFIDLISGNNRLLFTDYTLSGTGECIIDYQSVWL
jgi:hypothetical protein